MDTHQIKEGLLDYRIQEELSQKEMAEKLSMSEEDYMQYESEEPPVPDIDTLCLMSEVTNRSVDYLLFGRKAAEDKALKKLPKDFQVLCEMSRDLDFQNAESFQTIFRFMKFLEKMQNKNNEEKTDGNI